MDFVISAFATFAVASMLTTSAGPGDIFIKLRDSKLKKLLDCFLCTATWVAMVVALYTATGPLNWLVLTLGLTGAAAALDRLGY